MNIKINEIKLPTKLELKTPIIDNDFLNLSIDYLDDGYELTDLEEYVYLKNNITVDKNFLKHSTSIDHWFIIQSDHIYCDHSAILYRYSFTLK